MLAAVGGIYTDAAWFARSKRTAELDLFGITYIVLMRPGMIICILRAYILHPAFLGLKQFENANQLAPQALHSTYFWHCLTKHLQLE